MDISFVLPGYPTKPMGGFRAVYEYSNHLTSRGHRVTVIHALRFSGWQPPPPPHLLGKLRFSLEQLRDRLLRPEIRWQELDPAVTTVFLPTFDAGALPQADAVFATGWQTVRDVLSSPANRGRKFYFIQGYETWGGDTEQVHATWRAQAGKVVVSRWLYDKGIELGISASEMTHVPNGINHSLFRLSTPIEQRAPKVAMMYGKGLKGGDDGIEALEAVKGRFPQLQAVLFSGCHRRPSRLPRWIEYVRNPKPQQLVDLIYNKSSIYLCPSWTEGWGLPAAEAMACGCAVVSTDNGGVNDYATHGETALLSPPKEPARLAQNLMRLLQDDALRLRLATAGNRNIRKFSWKKSTDLLERCLRDQL